MVNIVIRPLASTNDMRACEELQVRVWALPDGFEVVPSHVLMAVPKNGGLVLGAFDGEELVGFLFGYPGFKPDGKLKHCSHMMGVVPGYQGAGIGYRLKRAQREFVLSQGLDLVTWTFDPLESRNARLNLHKLGAVSRTYLPDYYGPLSDGLNKGLPTDRLEVEWWVAGGHVRQRLKGEDALSRSGSVAQANMSGKTATGLLTPGTLVLNPSAQTVLFEIPLDYQAIKAADPGLALEWRMAAREVLEAHFSAGYAAIDFRSHVVDGERRSSYVLQMFREDLEPVGLHATLARQV
jgi:predicted GNAT superfamily acetyltransferase